MPVLADDATIGFADVVPPEQTADAVGLPDDADAAGQPDDADDATQAKDSEGDAQPILPPEGEWCTVDGWCAQHPQIPPFTLNAVWPAAPDDVWVVGELGAFLHGGETGGIMGRIPAGTTLHDMVGFPGGEMLAVGDSGQCWRHDGPEWVAMPTGTDKNLDTVGGPAPDDLWTAWGEWIQYNEFDGAYESHLLHLDQDGWSEWDHAPSLRVRSIRAAADGTTFLAGVESQGQGCTDPPLVWTRILRFESKKWSYIGELPGLEVMDMWAANHDEVWLVADKAPETFDFEPQPSFLLRFDGQDLEEIASVEGTSFVAVFGLSSEQIWAASQDQVMHLWDGKNMEEYPLPPTEIASVSAIRGISPDDVWAVGSYGAMYHWDGTAWEALQQVSMFGDIYSFAGTAEDDVWAVGGLKSDWLDSGAVTVHWDGSGWNTVDNPLPPYLYSVVAFDDGTAWAVGNDMEAIDSFAAAWDGNTWTQEPMELSPGTILRGLWGTSPDSLWAAGTRMDELNPPHVGVIVQRTQDGWSQEMLVDDAILMGIRGFPGSDVWAWGQRPSKQSALLLRLQDGQWKETLLPDAYFIRDVHGSAPDDVWATGIALDGQSQDGIGVLLRWDGAEWTTPPADPLPPLLSVWASSEKSVWITSEWDVFHWDGNDSATEQTAWPAGTGDIFSAGHNLWISSGNVILHRKL